MLSDLKSKIDRSPTLFDYDVVEYQLTIPVKAERLNKYLAFGADGNLTVASGTSSDIVVSAFGATLVDDVNAATALQTLGLTASAAELNILDGVTASTSELNILDGVTASTAELNILDGVTASTAELNILDGATLTVTELNYLDGVTSAIQAQLNTKYDSDDLASQAEAEAGTDNTTLMTPLRAAQAIGALAKPTYGTEVAATSGTAIGFTGIPSSATQITLILRGVATSANSNLLVQLGTSGGYVTTGYVGAYFTQGGNASLTTGLGSLNGSTGVANNGTAQWSKVGTGNDWVGTMTVGHTVNSSSAGASVVAGDAVDRIRITTASGTPTFTAGSINIFWE
jgi:hypothetical protein